MASLPHGVLPAASARARGGSGAAAARGGCPCTSFVPALRSDKHRLPRGELPVGAAVGCLDARTASLGTETGRFYSNAGV